MARLMDTLLIALSSFATACSLFPTRQTACSQDRPCPSGQYCHPDTATCEASPAVEDMAMPADLATPPGMILVPGGQFTMGDDSSAIQNQKPARVQVVSPFFLDVTEVTVGAYRNCVETMGCSLPVSGVPCNWGQSGKDDHPINCLPWLYADRYCDKIGKRLPTEIEFEYVVRGSGGASYSWGMDAPISPPDSRAQLCWNRKSNPLIATCVVGSYPKTLLGAFDENGVYDLLGNVDEYTSHLLCEYPLTQNGGVNCDPLNDRIYRGRSFFEGTANNLRATFRFSIPETSNDATIGFRCAKSL